MKTNWTPERIEELKNKLDQHIAQKNYAQEIADKIGSLKDLNAQVRRAYEMDLSYEELEVMWKMQDRMEKSIMMKVKHFFDMIYGKDNTFTANIKGRGYLDHYFAFKDYVEGMLFNIKVA